MVPFLLILLVFNDIILQCDRSVCEGADVHCLLDRQLTMWKDESFDVLIQEAERCDRSLCNSYHSTSRHTNDHYVRVFTKLMLQGNAHAAVSWITKHVSGGVLRHSDSTMVNHTVMSVVDTFLLKHPEPLFPPESVLPCCDSLP